jgi:F0F1-type ATP synthase assembly protein I
VANPQQPAEHGAGFKSAAPYLTLGIQLALAVLVFFFLGRWLDQELNTSPWLMLTGIMIGVVGGLINFFRTVIELTSHQDERHDQRHNEPTRNTEA